jgi:large subunit ribosomal protein L23
VKVKKVATMVVPGKTKRRGATSGKRPNWKKAIITLQQGENIDFFATE